MFNAFVLIVRRTARFMGGCIVYSFYFKSLPNLDKVHMNAAAASLSASDCRPEQQ